MIFKSVFDGREVTPQSKTFGEPPRPPKPVATPQRMVEPARPLIAAPALSATLCPHCKRALTFAELGAGGSSGEICNHCAQGYNYSRSAAVSVGATALTGGQS